MADDAARDGASIDGNGMIQRQQQTPTSNGVGPTTLTLGTPTMPGSLLVLTLAANDLSSLVLPTGWTTAASTGANGGCFSIIAYMPNTPGGVTQVSYTMSAGAPNVATLTEVIGASPTAPLDVVGQTTSASPVTSQSVSTSAPTAFAPELAIALFCEDVNTPTYTPGTWMRLGNVTNGSASPSYEADFNLFGAGVVPSETVTSDVAGKYTGLIASFRAQ